MTKAQVEFMLIMLNGRVAAARKDERGASAVEWVVITAILVGIAVAVGAILLRRLTGKAESLDLDE